VRQDTVTVSVNGAEAPVENGLHTWGDLVLSLDARLTPNRLVVTSVRLDGVEEPAFRDPALCASRLSAYRRIDIETGEPEMLARRSLGDAAEALSELGRVARDAADRFRIGDIGPAQQDLEQVSQGLLMVLRIVAAASLALRREIESPDQRGLSVAALTSQLDGFIRGLLDAQCADDWLRIADILDDELTPVMVRWQQALARLAAG
jgi:hypothetical protein